MAVGKIAALIAALAVGGLLATGSAAAGASAGSSHRSSHSAASHRSRASSAGKATAKALPAGTHFMRKTCKTAACKAKHPGGTYMLPIKPKAAKEPKPAG
jgi:hypothetical protein